MGLEGLWSWRLKVFSVVELGSTLFLFLMLKNFYLGIVLEVQKGLLKIKFMKKKNGRSQQLVTRAILRDELMGINKRMDGFERKMDRFERRMDEMEAKMYTKEDHSRFEAYINLRFDEIEAKMYTKEDHAKFMIYMDEAMTELRDAREERQLNERQMLRMDDQIDNHEKRIVKLEEKTAA